MAVLWQLLFFSAAAGLSANKRATKLDHLFPHSDWRNEIFNFDPMPEFSQHDLTENETRYTALELCPEADFQMAAERLSKELPGSFDKIGGVEALTAHYVELAGAGKRTCLKEPMKERDGPREFWPKSKGKPGELIFNIGEGTTGTRSINCMMEGLGFNSRHGFTCEVDHVDCTQSYDSYEYVSDTPLASHMSQLLATHPKSPVWLSTRDPDSWLKHRLENLARHDMPEEGIDFTDAENFRMAAPCGLEQPLMNTLENARFGRLVMDSWGVCLASMQNGRTEDDLWIVNLFKEKTLNPNSTVVDSNKKVIDSLWAFIQKNEHMKDRFESKKKILDAMNECGH